jgi:two-component system cell cycle sensor histidine kinase/response regulator CckA
MARILLVEDEPELRRLLAEALETHGFAVVQAGDGLEALEQLKAHPGLPLLLSDIRMPNMDGHALVEAALALRPELKVLLMTAYPTDRPQPAALYAREIRTLSKPFPVARMIALVEEMLARA